MTPEEYKKLLAEHGTLAGVARYLGRNERSLRRWVKRHIKDEEGNPQDLLPYLREPRTTEVLANMLGKSSKTILSWIAELQEKGYNIVQQGGWYLNTRPVREDVQIDLLTTSRRIKFGVVSDSHLSSIKQQLSSLNAMYDYFQRQGITDVFHAGDLTAGVDVYRGQHNELFLHTETDQSEYAIKYYPERPGITTHLIGGNHDLNCLKKGGLDPLKLVAAKRKDIKYYGRYSAWVNLTPNCRIYLLHPEGGPPTPRAAAKLYNAVDGFRKREKPDVLILGHWHQQAYVPYRGVHCIMPGCFEGLTTFEERRGMEPDIGGAIINFCFTEDGRIESFDVEFVSFREIQNDYPKLEAV